MAVQRHVAGGLVGVHVQAGSPDLAGLQSGQQRILVHVAAPGGVDDHHAVLHLGNALGVDERAAVHSGGVDGDEVGLGQQLGVMAKAIGMKVIAFDIYQIPVISEQLDIPYVEMDELLAQADFISVHAPAVDGGALINAENIAKMKDGVVIINTSRGTNVDEAALLAALESGKVRAAGLDVWAEEPAKNVALYSHPRVSCTPHIGAATQEAQARIGTEIVSVIESFFA